MNLLFVDTETGGLDPQKHSLLEAHFVAYKDNEILGDLHLPINSMEFTVTQRALQVNQIDLRTHEGLPVGNAFLELKAFIEKHFGEERPYLAGYKDIQLSE